jgi:hypothetical protein
VSKSALGYVSVVPPSYPINSVYLWMGGPEEAVPSRAVKAWDETESNRSKCVCVKEKSRVPNLRMDRRPLSLRGVSPKAKRCNKPTSYVFPSSRLTHSQRDHELCPFADAG